MSGARMPLMFYSFFRFFLFIFYSFLCRCADLFGIISEHSEHCHEPWTMNMVFFFEVWLPKMNEISGEKTHLLWDLVYFALCTLHITHVSEMHYFVFGLSHFQSVSTRPKNKFSLEMLLAKSAKESQLAFTLFNRSIFQQSFPFHFSHIIFYRLWMPLDVVGVSSNMRLCVMAQPKEHS